MLGLIFYPAVPHKHGKHNVKPAAHNKRRRNREKGRAQ
jgi:hypothetical protein